MTTAERIASQVREQRGQHRADHPLYERGCLWCQDGVLGSQYASLEETFGPAVMAEVERILR